MKRIIVFIISVAILPAISISSVYAQDSEKKESLEATGNLEAKKVLAAKLFQLAGIDKELKQVVDKQIKLTILSRHLSNQATAGSKKEANVKEMLTNVLEQVFEKDVNIVDEMKPLVVDQFATEFSESELQYMIEFYESDLGKKLVRTTPKIAQEVMNQTLSKLTKRVNKVLETAIVEETKKASTPDI